MHRLASENVAEVLERVLDKGIIIDAWVRLSLVGIDLVSVDARVIVASFETYQRYAGELSAMTPAAAALVSRPLRKPRAGHDWPALRIVREVFDAWNRHDTDRYTALLHDRYVGETYHVAPPVRGRAAARQSMERYFDVLPDLHFTIEGAAAAGNNVIVSWLATGTPRLQSGGPLTAGPLQVPGCTVTRLRAGKVVHTWQYWDTTDCAF